MSVDLIALWLILATCPAITAFALIYTFTSPWWRSMIGRALFVSSWGFALLVDISLLYNWLGDNYALRDIVRLTVFALICGGAWLKLTALLSEKWRAHRGKSNRFTTGK